jgi:hypothetical protein
MRQHIRTRVIGMRSPAAGEGPVPGWPAAAIKVTGWGGVGGWLMNRCAGLFVACRNPLTPRHRPRPIRLSQRLNQPIAAQMPVSWGAVGSSTPMEADHGAPLPAARARHLLPGGMSGGCHEGHTYGALRPRRCVERRSARERSSRTRTTLATGSVAPRAPERCGAPRDSMKPDTSILCCQTVPQPSGASPSTCRTPTSGSGSPSVWRMSKTWRAGSDA